MAGTDATAGAVALHEALPLQCPDKTRSCAFRQPGCNCEGANGRRLRALEHVHEQLRRAIDRLGPGLGAISCAH